ncbi:hypothetical protein ACR6C2_22560 [Streptomyces sp. INA 01156]
MGGAFGGGEEEEPGGRTVVVRGGGGGQCLRRVGEGGDGRGDRVDLVVEVPAERGQVQAPFEPKTL